MADPQSDSRRIAWEVLQAVEGGSYADAELAKRLRGSGLDERDRGLATQLVYGTLAWQGFVDDILDKLGRPAAKLDLPVRALMRMALFQITKLDRIPDFAVVDTSVELAKRYKAGRAAGLVNALLRGHLRSAERPRGETASRPENLATRGSHPRWLVDRWIDLLGKDEAEQLLAADNRPAPTVLRVNRRRTNREQALEVLERAGHRPRPTQFSPDGVECDLRGGLTEMASFRDGLVSAQGEASQLIGHMIPTDAGSILDACAAPGGKATHLAERTGSRVVALDRSRSGIRNVARQARRLGVAVAPILADARTLPFRETRRFDAALVDAPCSGLGTLRQHPEIRWRRTPEDVSRLARVQAAILDSVADHVAPGGTLVYATCTLLPEENGQRVERFLHDHPEFELCDPRPDLPEAARELVADDFFLQTWPHRQGLDGFFAAKMRRTRT